MAAGSTAGIRAGRAYVELGVSDNLTKGLERARKSMEAFGRGLKTIGRDLMYAAAPLAGFGAWAVKAFADASSGLVEMSERTGASVESLSELNHVAKMTGASAEDLGAGFRFMQKTIGQASVGTKTAVDSLAQLGITVADLRALRPDQQFELLAGKIAGLSDETQRTAATLEIFGRGGSALLPMLTEGAGGIRRMREEFRALGGTVSTADAILGHRLGDTLDTTATLLHRVIESIGKGLAPMVITGAESISKMTASAREFIDAHGEMIRTIGKATLATLGIGGALFGLGVTISGLAIALKGPAILLTAVGYGLTTVATIAAGLLSPLGMLTAGVAILATGLYKFTPAGQAVRDALGGMWESFKEIAAGVGGVVTSIVDALTRGDIDGAAKVMFTGLNVVWAAGVAGLLDIWQGLSRGMLHALAVSLGGVAKLWGQSIAGFYMLREDVANSGAIAAAHAEASNSRTDTNRRYREKLGKAEGQLQYAAGPAEAARAYARDQAQIAYSKSRVTDTMSVDMALNQTEAENKAMAARLLAASESTRQAAFDAADAEYKRATAPLIAKYDADVLALYEAQKRQITEIAEKEKAAIASLQQIHDAENQEIDRRVAFTVAKIDALESEITDLGGTADDAARQIADAKANLQAARDALGYRQRIGNFADFNVKAGAGGSTGTGSGVLSGWGPVGDASVGERLMAALAGVDTAIGYSRYGQFGGMFAEQSSGGKTVQDRIATATEETAKGVKRIEQKGGLRWQ
jgi:hypothetical protein